MISPALYCSAYSSSWALYDASSLRSSLPPEQPAIKNDRVRRANHFKVNFMPSGGFAWSGRLSSDQACLSAHGARIASLIP